MTSMLYNSFGLARRSEKQFPLLSGQSSLKGVLERDNAMKTQSAHIKIQIHAKRSTGQ